MNEHIPEVFTLNLSFSSNELLKAIRSSVSARRDWYTGIKAANIGCTQNQGLGSSQ